MPYLSFKMSYYNSNRVFLGALAFPTRTKMTLGQKCEMLPKGHFEMEFGNAAV